APLNATNAPVTVNPTAGVAPTAIGGSQYAGWTPQRDASGNLLGMTPPGARGGTYFNPADNTIRDIRTGQIVQYGGSTDFQSPSSGAGATASRYSPIYEGDVGEGDLYSA